MPGKIFRKVREEIPKMKPEVTPGEFPARISEGIPGKVSVRISEGFPREEAF